MVSKYLYLHFDGVLLADAKLQDSVYSHIAIKNTEITATPEILSPVEIPLDSQQFALTILSKNTPLYGAVKFLVQDILSIVQEKPMQLRVPISSSPLTFDPKTKIPAKYPVALVTIVLKSEKYISIAYEEELIVEGNSQVLQAVLKELMDLTKDVAVINKKPIEDYSDVLKHKCALMNAMAQSDSCIVVSNEKISRIAKIKESISVYANQQKLEIEQIKKLLTEINIKLQSQGKISKDICDEKKSLRAYIIECRFKFKDFMNHANELKTLSMRLDGLKNKINVIKARNTKETETLIASIKSIQEEVVTLTKKCQTVKVEIDKIIESVNAQLTIQGEARDAINCKQANIEKALLEIEISNNALLDANRKISEERQKISQIKENHQDAIVLMKFKISKEQKIIEESRKNNANYTELSAKVTKEIQQEEEIGAKNKNAVIQISTQNISTEKSENERDQIMRSSNQVQFDDYLVKLTNCTTSGNEADSVADIKEKLSFLIQTREEMTLKIVAIQERIRSTTEKVTQIMENIIALERQNQLIITKSESMLLQYDIAQKQLVEMKNDQTHFSSKNILTKEAIAERQNYLKAKEDNLKDFEQRVNSLTFSISENEQQRDLYADQLRQINANIDEIKNTIKLNASIHERKMTEKNGEKAHLQQILDQLNLELEKIREEKKHKESLNVKAHDTYTDLSDRLHILEIENGKETYKAYAGDTVDAKLADYLKRHRSLVHFKRLEKGMYLYGTMKIPAVVQKNKLLFNIQHNLVPVEELLKIYEDIEFNKTRKPGASPKVDLTASSPMVATGAGDAESLRASLTKSLIEKGAIVVDSPLQKSSPKGQQPKKSS